METKNRESDKQNSNQIIENLNREVLKRDNIIKLLTGVIEVIKTDVNVKTQQLDYLINHMKNHNYEGFDYTTCIKSSDKKDSSKVLCSDFITLNETSEIIDKKIEKMNKHDLTSYKFRNMILIIFGYLNYKDIIRIGATCKKIYQLAKENEIWKNMYFNDYDMFLFFDEKEKCIVENMAKTKYEKNKDSIIYKNLNFRDKYLELKRIKKNWEENRPIVTTISTSECVTCLNLDVRSDELIYSSVDGSASIYRLYSFRKIASDDDLYMQHHKQTKICDKLSTFYGHSGPIWCIDRHEEVLFTGSYDKTIKLWDIKSGNCLSTMRNHTSWVSSIQYDPAYDFLLSGSWDCTIRLWNMKTMHNTLTLNSQPGNFIYCVRSNLKHNEVIAGTELKTIDVWDVNRRNKLMILYGHLERINNLKYFNEMILSGSEDKQARLWDKRTGNCEILFTGHSKGITQVEVDMSNNRIFTGSIDKTIKIWDIRKNQEVRTLIGHSNSVYSIAYDQTKLISGSKDNTIRIWNFLY
jgi:WD40 repeat protein